MNAEFQKKMISQDGQDANYERKNDILKGKIGTQMVIV
jgi:hypothetical protein